MGGRSGWTLIEKVHKLHFLNKTGEGQFQDGCTLIVNPGEMVKYFLIPSGESVQLSVFYCNWKPNKKLVKINNVY